MIYTEQNTARAFCATLAFGFVGYLSAMASVPMKRFSPENKDLLDRMGSDFLMTGVGFLGACFLMFGITLFLHKKSQNQPRANNLSDEKATGNETTSILK
jgi:hypothetical protein